MTEETNAAGAPEMKKKNNRDHIAWIAIIIIAVVIVFASLLITVLIVPEFKTIGDLFAFIGKQF